MRPFAAISVDDDFPAGDSAISYRAANNKTTGRVDKEFGVGVKHVLWQHGLNDLFHDRFFEIGITDGLIVLS